MKTISRETTTTRYFQMPDYASRVSAYLGQASGLDAGPQAFLVEIEKAGARVEPHFHDIDQFQVFVAGNGRFGNKQVHPIAFHYADAYTPYGPIVADDDGFSFFTIRLACSGGYFPMPEARNKLPGNPGRNITGYFELGTERLQAGQCVHENLVEEPDGMRVAGLRLGPNARAAGLPMQGGGHYYLVCSGSLRQADKELGMLSLIFPEPNEAPPGLQAGADGAELLLLQFSRPSVRFGSDPKVLAARKLNEYSAPPSSSWAEVDSEERERKSPERGN